MNMDNLTPAHLKAIDNGGTSNLIVGRSLVKRGIMIENGTDPGMQRFVLSAEYIASRDADVNTVLVGVGTLEGVTDLREARKAAQESEEAITVQPPANTLAELVGPRTEPLDPARPVGAQPVEVANGMLHTHSGSLIGSAYDPNATRFEDIARWTSDRLDTQEEALSRRLGRRTLLGADRRLTENRLSRVRAEIARRGL